MMFPEGPSGVSPFGHRVPSSQIAKTVWGDIERQDAPLTKEQIADEVEVRVPWPRNIWQLEGEQREAAWKKYEEDSKTASAKRTVEFLEEAGDSIVYRFSYSDSDGDYFTVLEHGDIFSSLPNHRSSHH